MRHRKKILIAVIFICLLSVWFIFFLRMHIAVKEPIEEVYRQGDILKYYGLEITVGDLEVYDFNEFVESYGKPDDMYSDTEKDRYIVVNIHVKNISGQDIRIQNTISTWNMSIDNYTNGQSMDLMTFNQIPISPYEKDAEVDLKLFFRFTDGQTYQGNVEKIKASPIRIYLSYYPELRYIQYH